MVDKLIRGKIVEIVVVLLMVIISIPVWNSFEDKISTANIMELDKYNLEFDIRKNTSSDLITINNNYYINKQYKLMIVVDNKVDENNSKIKINNTIYKLSDFKSEKDRNNKIYILINDFILANTVDYEISPSLNGKNSNYSYIFEEKSIF